jgi:uracil-DNA glycosylase family 4
MNLISTPTPNQTAKSMIHSLQDWWSLAGVELDYAEQPAALLAVEPVVAMPVAPTPAAVTERVEEEARAPVQDVPLPSVHAEFVNWLAHGDNLIEASWSKHRVAPQGGLEPEVMVISALPEKNRNGDIQLFAPDHQKLLEKMLSAIGCESRQSYIATISVAASFDGRIDEQHWASLKNRAVHHIGLVRPKRVICLGDLASKILFGEDMLTARKNKQFINHESSKTEAIVTFHPRILIERPLFKAEAWKDLQMLTRISAP